jgi:8-oxo-dGTP pyrophosphatase MutT (NUDIX family)
MRGGVVALQQRGPLCCASDPQAPLDDQEGSMRLLPLALFKKDGPTAAGVHVDGVIGAVANFRPGPCPNCGKNHEAGKCLKVGEEIGTTGLRQLGGHVLEKAAIKFAGLCVKAEDTGRVLMLKRSHLDLDDPEAGKYEFPGGHLEPGEDPLQGALREHSEEVGTKAPPGRVIGSWRSGPYEGFVWLTPTETVDPENWHAVWNPDGPNAQHRDGGGDIVEQVSWFDPQMARKLSKLRSELLGADDVWDLIEEAGEPGVGLGLGAGAGLGLRLLPIVFKAWDVQQEAREPAGGPGGGRWTSGAGGGQGPQRPMPGASPSSSIERRGFLPTSVLSPSHDVESSLIWSPREQARLEDDVKANGIREPLQVAYGQTDYGGKQHYILEDGNHRLRAAQRLGLREVPVVVRHEPYYSADGSKSPPGGELPHFRALTEAGGEAKGPAEPAIPEDWKANDAPERLGIFWHGSPNGEVGMVVATNGVHVGTYRAAKEALEARIGKRADGKDWDGSQEYGKTLVGSSGAGYGIRSGMTGASLPTGEAVYSDGSPVGMDAKPDLFPVRIVGSMSNTPATPHKDFKANGYMSAALKRGHAKNGYYYANQGEGGIDQRTSKGGVPSEFGRDFPIWDSISAVVPSAVHLQRLDHPQLEATVMGPESDTPAIHGRWNPDTKAAVLARLQTLARRFPIAGPIRSLGTTKSTGVEGVSNAALGTMNFSSQIARGIPPGAPFGTATQSTQGMVDHEFGHFLLDAMRNEDGWRDSALEDSIRAGLGEPWLDAGKVHRWEGPELFDRLERQLGGSYANKSLDEAFCEALANGLSDNPSPVGKEVVSLAEAWMEPMDLEPSLKL